MTIPSPSGETALEVGAFISHAEFIAGTPNGSLGAAVIMRIPVGSALQTMVELNPTSTAASMVQPSV